MHIKSIVAGAALAFALMAGSASAAEEFTTLKGLPAVAMAPTELAATRGTFTNTLTTAGTTLTIVHNAGPGREKADAAVPGMVVFSWIHDTP